MAEPEPSGGANDFDFKPLEVEVNSVADLGKALTAEADHFGEAAKDVKEQLANDADDQLGQYGDVPVGVDPGQETLRDVAGSHSQSMEDMNAHLTNVETGLRNLGLVTQAITSQFGNQDALNSADVGAVGEVMYKDMSTPAQDAASGVNREALGEL